MVLGILLLLLPLLGLPTSLAYVLIPLFGAGWLFYWYFVKPRPLPGPKGIPGLGYLPFLDQNAMPVAFAELGKKFYGSIFSVPLGNFEIVVLNDYNTIRKSFLENGDAFSGRMKRPGQAQIDRLAHLDLVANDGDEWREHRRFALSKFRDYGIGRSSIEPAIINEITYFLDELEKLRDEPINPMHLLSMSVCNNVVILAIGKRFEYTDPDFNKLAFYVDRFIKQAVFRLDFAFRFLRSIPGFSQFLKVETRRKELEELNDLIEKIVRGHMTNYKEGDDADYVNAYLTERKERTKTNNFANFFTDETLIANVRVLFIAGMETTTTTLRWAFLFMMLHPDVQRRIHKEIDEVIGDNRMPSYEDRVRMPYTEAVLYEVHRVGSIIPFSVPHRVTRDVEVNNLQLRKDMVVFPNLYAVHYDESLFPDPNSFRPERFLNEDGQLVRPEAVIPFSLGKRFCLGEPLARMELFLYFTCMLQRFEFQTPENTVFERRADAGGVKAPLPYKTKLVLRRNKS